MTPEEDEEEESVDANDEPDDDVLDIVSGSSVYGANEGWEYVRESIGISFSRCWYKLRDFIVLI